MSESPTIGVVGSGIMGAGVAEVAARAGYRVVVRSRSKSAADQLVSLVDRGLAKSVERGRLTDDERQAIVGRIQPTDRIGDLAGCSLVIESVVEDLAVKKELFTQLDEVVDAQAILATNTSTLPVIEMAMATRRPERVCGIHFFNPAPAMALVEIIRPLTAADDTIRAATEFATACGKDPVEVKDRAGFIVNALLFPFLNNAVRMWEHGTATIEHIDAAMKGACNFPMGPFQLLDLVGLDTSVAILDALHAEFGDPNYTPTPSLRRMVAAGHLGRKTRRGFYDY